MISWCFKERLKVGMTFFLQFSLQFYLENISAMPYSITSFVGFEAILSTAETCISERYYKGALCC